MKDSLLSGLLSVQTEDQLVLLQCGLFLGRTDLATGLEVILTVRQGDPGCGDLLWEEPGLQVWVVQVLVRRVFL